MASNPVERPEIGPGHVATADLHVAGPEEFEELVDHRRLGPLGDDGRLGDDQAAEVVRAQGQLDPMGSPSPARASTAARTPAGPKALE